jgi:hypothetical protein
VADDSAVRLPTTQKRSSRCKCFADSEAAVGARGKAKDSSGDTARSGSCFIADTDEKGVLASDKASEKRP